MKYTTQLGAGLGLIDETKALLEIYESEDTTASLYEKALDSGRFSNVTARRLRNIIAECFAPRHIKNDSGLYLKLLASSLSSSALQQIFLIHTAECNQILRDFIATVFWPRYASGVDILEPEDAKAFVISAVEDGKTTIHWADATIKRQSSYLLSCCSDYGLLSPNKRGRKTVQHVRIEDEAFFYLAHLLHFRGLSDHAIIHHPNWMLFGLETTDVMTEFKRTSRKGWYIVQAAGTVMRITWNYKSMQEAIDVISEK